MLCAFTFTFNQSMECQSWTFIICLTQVINLWPKPPRPYPDKAPWPWHKLQQSFFHPTPSKKFENPSMQSHINKFILHRQCHTLNWNKRTNFNFSSGIATSTTFNRVSLTWRNPKYTVSYKFRMSTFTFHLKYQLNIFPILKSIISFRISNEKWWIFNWTAYLITSLQVNFGGLRIYRWFQQTFDTLVANYIWKQPSGRRNCKFHFEIYYGILKFSLNFGISNRSFTCGNQNEY